jgi:hypothetical protein
MAEQAGSQGDMLYSERNRVKWLLPILAICWVGLLVGVIVSSLSGSVSLAIVLGVVTVVFVVLDFLFDPLSYLITADKVAFGFPGYKKIFPRSALISCEPYELTFRNYGGYGVRWGRDGTTAFNTRSGPGVKMVFEGAKRPYVVSVDEPEKVWAILSGKQV